MNEFDNNENFNTDSEKPIENGVEQPVEQPIEVTVETDEQQSEPTFTEPTFAEPTFTEQNEQQSQPTPPQNNYFNPYQQTPPPQNFNNGNKKSGTGFKIFCLVLAAVVLITLGTGAGYLIGGMNKNNSLTANDGVETKDSGVTFTENKVPQKEGISPDANGNYTESQVAELVSPSVVSITVYTEDKSSQSSGALASGVIIDKEGYIISNDHIYSGIPNAKFVITLSDNTSYPATFVAGDTKSDISVLKMEGAKNLTPASFGDSTSVKEGDKVISIGNPYGFSNSVTSGIVSSANRRIRNVNNDKANSNSQTSSGSAYTMRVIQTDAALNHGSSGGALVNMKGQIVGINSSKIVVDSYEGICFAIPSNDAVKVAKSLTANKKVVGRARLGISYVEMTTAYALVNKCPSGLVIASIDTDSSLYNKGFGENDIITEINGKAITTADIALDVIADSNAGDTVKLKIYSAKTQQYSEVDVKLLEDQSVSSYKTQIDQNTEGDEVSPFKLQPTTTKAKAN